MLQIGHVELLVVLAVSFAIQLGGLVILGLQLYDSRKMLTESRRMDTAIGALVIQEADKIRQLVTRP